MKAYKGFDKNLKCRGYQYEVGKEYEEPEAKLCDCGFHACERPLDVLHYYDARSGRYCEVELDDVSPERADNDTKVAARKIRIGAEIGIPGLVKAQIEYVKAHTTMEHTDPKQATAGFRGAATAGYSGAATAGDSGAANSRGSVSVGKNGCGLVRGNDVKVRGGLGAILVICEENETDYDIADWKAIVVDGDIVKAETWYMLKDGKLVESEA